MTTFAVPAEVAHRLATGQRPPVELVDVREVPAHLTRHGLRMVRAEWRPGEKHPTLYVEDISAPAHAGESEG